MSWDIEYEIQNVNSNIHVFRNKLFDLPLNAENYVVLQYFKAGIIKINYTSANIFLFFSGFAACIGLTVITTYRKLIWFIPGSALFAIWLAFFKLDALAVFGFYNNTMLLIALILFLGEAYLFHSIITKISFVKRFLAFFITMAIFGTIIILFSEVHSPVVYLTNFGLIVPCIITMLFVFIIGYEIPHLMINVITYSRSENPWVVPMNFLIAVSLYVGNIIIYFLYRIGDIEWQVPYNIYLFFPICAVIGIWSHRKRSSQYH